MKNDVLTQASKGTVYLIHLKTKIGHAQHYIGWALNVKGRLFHHRKGKGSRFLAAANSLGIDYDVVREWPGDKQFERQLKNRKCAPRYCPICRKNH